MIEVREVSENKEQICEKTLRSLPNWFGIEQAILDYIEDVKKMPMFCAFENENFVGFMSINLHNESTGEIHVMGLLPGYHRQGIGEKLVLAGEEYLKNKGFHFLTVKTLSPSREDEYYARTRLFYEKNGFKPLEEFKTLWGEANPCLFLAKPLVSSSSSHPSAPLFAQPGFTKQEGTSFWYRHGPAKEAGKYCNKKLCFAATDLKFLAELLNWLSTHDDCFFVKYSEKSRDGIYLGRCFFTTEKKVGEIWTQFKLHPKVHCNIQDDDFSQDFRETVRRWESCDPFNFDD